MIYFYCSEAIVEGVSIRFDGVVELEREIQSAENAMNVLAYVKKNAIEGIRKKIPDISLNEDQIILLAFNPL